MFETNQWLQPLFGGALIGLGALLLLVMNGRIAGISGILGGLKSLSATREYWRLAFLLGLLVGGIACFQFFPGAAKISTGVSLPLVIFGGLLVGAGTRLGSGCTSGHGVCGLGRFSLRSIVAVCVFLITAVVTSTSMYLLFTAV
jgi:uncharacterized protein